MNTERYNRQILLPELGEEGQTKIRNARVLLVGVGGLGSPIALYLTGAGVGCLGLVDDDVVSISNLHRQVLYNEQEVGQSKAICASRRLQMLNSEVKIETYPFRLTEENAREIIGQYDVVVDGCDKKNNIPYVYGGICGWEGQVSIFCHPSSHTTYRTLFPDEAATLSMPHPGKQVIGMTPGIIGSTEATEVIKLIANVGEPLIDKIWAIDLRTLQTHLINL